LRNLLLQVLNKKTLDFVAAGAKPTVRQPQAKFITLVHQLLPELKS
jgi:hypothetical protein